MMDFMGFGMAWMWIFGLLLLTGLVLLIVFLVRALSAGPNRGSRRSGEATRARGILEERYARGKLSTEEYQERLRILNENS
ncbi:SHOCT domain-containing protein [Arthrobacter crystallopoietes]|uniref:Putative membrane protein n=1 Tax=Crystallibacter crystallopoietes TaxID=37928 RepID=A0A1H1FYU4_9MICC|nr:SHOCT domain-containing protein [Arthrobacter crystallopoietes]AUI52860.1 hypothetical protein AC20117_20745 [Arthrobacter crystallopoietes]SDR05949.1 putative membrane protein [Arthrobacter crystallopoietes]